MREEQMKEGREVFMCREKEDRREKGGKRYVHTYTHMRGSRRLKIGVGGERNFGSLRGKQRREKNKTGQRS